MANLIKIDNYVFADSDYKLLINFMKSDILKMHKNGVYLFAFVTLSVY